MYKLSIFFVSIFIIACTPKTVHVWKDDIHTQKNFNLYVVEKIISGDTIKLTDGKIVRYIGMRSPEKGEVYFEEARKMHQHYLANGNVFLKFEKNNYSKKQDNIYYAYAFKPRGVVYSFINLELIERGCAVVDNSYPKILPKYEVHYYNAQNKAKNKAGLWKYK